MRIIGKRSCHENTSEVLLQRQHAALVLEQNDRFVRGAFGHRNMLRGANHAIGSGWIRDVRLVEETQPELDSQNIADARVDRCHRELT